jgi:DNA-binding response OmpR family regulator
MSEMSESPVKILIADDEPNMLRMLGYAFHREGFEVIVAQTGAETVEKSVAENPDLLILDVMMPGIDGLEICRQLRNTPQTQNLPIIMLSARTQVADKVAGLQAGADEYVPKPVEMVEMVARVQALLERTRRLRQTQQAAAGRVLSVVGAKGGVGTTTVALNVAASIARQGNSVIAAELRAYYGTVSAQLQVEPAVTLANLLEYEPEMISRLAIERLLFASSFGAKVLFGPQKDDGICEILPEHGEMLVQGLRELADYVVLDLPNYPTMIHPVATQMSDFTMLVVEPEPICLLAGNVMLNLFNAWGIRPSRIGAVIVNRAASAATLNPGDVKARLGCEIMGVIPPMAEACQAAHRKGMPVVLTQPDLVASQNLAEMSARLGEENVMPLQF